MFILASASTSRRKLLKGYTFRVVPSGVREVKLPGLKATCVANARLKADAVAARFPTAWVLAADTMIAYGGKIYGKPRDRKAAAALLRKLSGKTHVLGTGVVLQKGSFRIVKYVTSKVTLHDDPPIDKIVRAGDPTRYAGGYAIREKNDPLIARIDGSRSNVIGLPMEVLAPLLKRLDRS
ncbi:MAG TPA: nucleoside triphosphate pyrophosphatase [Planctomycetota bacterium]|nr:nucleoside triphosphate pyrophosphatase [Planctomycetota bacterium]